MVSIYQYLDERFGMSSHKTGAWFFFISKILGAAVRLFLVCVTLQLMVFGPLGLPFIVNVLVCMGIVLVYTFRGGVKSVIWTDALKTICMIVSIVLAMVFISRNLGMDFKAMAGAIRDSSYSRIFFFDDVNHPEYFWKQFLAGVFTVIAMTGLDQDMMQRTLSSRNARDSRKNLITSGLLQMDGERKHQALLQRRHKRTGTLPRCLYGTGNNTRPGEKIHARNRSLHQRLYQESGCVQYGGSDVRSLDPRHIG